MISDILSDYDHFHINVRNVFFEFSLKSKVALMFNISASQVRRISIGERWKHLGSK